MPAGSTHSRRGTRSEPGHLHFPTSGFFITGLNLSSTVHVPTPNRTLFQHTRNRGAFMLLEKLHPRRLRGQRVDMDRALCRVRTLFGDEFPSHPKLSASPSRDA